MTIPTAVKQAEVWYECKAFAAFPWTVPTAEAEQVVEFHGEGAEAKARAWYEHKRLESEIDATYLYEVNGEERTLITSWSDTYGPDYGDGDDLEDMYDEFDEYDAELGYD